MGGYSSNSDKSFRHNGPNHPRTVGKRSTRELRNSIFVDRCSFSSTASALVAWSAGVPSRVLGMTSVVAQSVSVRYNLLSRESQNIKRQFINVIAGKREPSRSIEALKDVSFEFSAGSRVAVIGPNGAGKTTLLRVISGSLVPSRGDIHRRGRIFSLLGNAGSYLDHESSGLENCEVMLRILGISNQSKITLIDEICRLSGLAERIADPVYTYSSGMQARLRLAVLLKANPEILVMDEGFATTDAEFDKRMSPYIAEFMRRPSIVFIATHSLKYAMESCNSAIYLRDGSIRCVGPAKDVLQRYEADLGQISGA